MSLDNLQDIRFFNQVVRSQGFTAAAQVMQLPVNTISRRIALLEQQLGVRLLNRTTRKISLTEEGEVLFERSQDLLEGFERLHKNLTKTENEISGTIRIVVRTATIESGFIEDLSEKLKEYEQLKIQLIVSDSPVDLVADGIDLALMINDLPDSSFIQKKLGDVVFALCAAPDYLKDRNAIHTPDDLVQHRFISPLKKHPQTSLMLRKKGGRTDQKFSINPQLQANDIRARATAIYAGAGIGNLPITEIIRGRKEGKLIPILPEYTLPPIQVWSLKTLDRKNDPRLKLIEKLLIKSGKRMCCNEFLSA